MNLKLATAQPSYTSPGTTGAGLDLEVVYAGLGSEADFIGRDVRGKAVLLFSNPMPGSWRHTATQEGAIARTLTGDIYRSDDRAIASVNREIFAQQQQLATRIRELRPQIVLGLGDSTVPADA